MDKLIRSVQSQLPERRGVSRFFTAIQLFCLFIISAAQRAIALLFQSPQKSFTVFHNQDGRGIWNGSFHQHQIWKSKVRLFSWSSLTILVVASVVSFASAQLIFPGATEQVLASTSTFTVSNVNDSGAGSLRQALTDCNAVGSGNDCVIELANAVDLGTLTPTSNLPTLTKPAVFSNLGSDTDFIISGASLTDNCLRIGAGADGTVIEGIGFEACPTAAIFVQDTAANIQIGNTSSDSDKVYFSAGKWGVAAAGDNVTVKNAVFGTGADGLSIGQSEYAIYSIGTASGTTIMNSTVERATLGGIFLSGPSNVTVTNNTISSNTGYGITLSAVATATISGNAISSNGSCGLSIANGSDQVYTTNTIAGNTSHAVCVSGSPSNVRLGATSAATASSQGNSISASGSNSVIFMGTATPSGFNLGYNATLSQGGTAPVIGYTFGSEPFAEATNVVATTTQITGTAAVSSGYIAAYQNSTFIGSTTLSGTSFTITGSDLVGTLNAGSNIKLVTLNSSNNPSIMSLSHSVETPADDEDEETSGTDITVVPSINSAQFSGSSAHRVLRIKVYVATTEAGLVSDVPDVGAYGTSHAVTVSGLSSATLYYWKVTADADDGSFSNFELDSGTFTTDAAPVVNEEDDVPTATTITVDPDENTAVLTFSTTESLTPKVYISRSQPDVLSATPVTGTAGKSHSVTVTGLTADTLYYYAVTGTADDNSFTDSNLGTGSFTTDASELDDNFLSENATLNDQVVYDPAKKLYLGPDEVNLELENTTKDSDVFFEIKEKETNDVVLSTDWQSITKQVINKTFKNLEQGVEYILKGTLRKTDDTTKQDSAKTISKFEKTDRKAPAFATYSGNVTVTAVPTVKMGGELSGLAGEVILQDIVTGKTAASCDIPKGGSLCTLEPYPAPGDYRIQFRSVKAKVPSAPDQTLFTIAKATPTSTLFVDRGNANFMNRIVLNDSVKVVGNAVKSADVEIYLNGTKIKTIEHKKNKTTAWEYNLSLKGKAKKSYILRVIYRDRASDKFVKTFTMPFVYSSGVADLVVQNLRESYSPGAAAKISILGGRGDVVSAYVDGVFVNNLELEQIGTTPIGKAELTLPTSAIGSHTIELSARNSVGLRGETVRETYSVVRPTPVAVAAVEEEPEIVEAAPSEPTTVEEPVVPVQEIPTTNINNSTNTSANSNTAGEEQTTNTNTETPTTNNPESVTNPEIQSPVPIEELPASAQALIKDDIATAGLITIDPSVTDIGNVPQQYLTSVTDEVQKAAITAAVAKTFEIKTVVEFVRIETAASGEQTTTPAGVDPGAVPVFTQQKKIGLPGFGEQAATENHGIQLSGTSLPYALIKVTVRSTPIVKMTRADENGKWTMTVPADTLEPGKHTASLQTESQGVVSESVEIANFVIVEDQKLSNTTWVVIINVFIAALILILVLGIQLGRKNRGGGGGGRKNILVPTAPDQATTSTIGDGRGSGGALGV